MTSFRVKNISEIKTVGEKLREARERAGLEIKQVADRLKISGKYLQALENDAYNQIPGEVYAKNFLKSYGLFLDLNMSEIFVQYAKEKKLVQKTLYKKTVGEISDQQLRRWPKILRDLAVIILVVLCFVYLGYKVQKIFIPPRLAVSQPIDNLVTNTAELRVVGATDKDVEVEINGQKVSVDDQLKFNEKIDLQKGINTIKIIATKKHGQTATIERRVLFQP